MAAYSRKRKQSRRRRYRTSHRMRTSRRYRRRVGGQPTQRNTRFNIPTTTRPIVDQNRIPDYSQHGIPVQRVSTELQGPYSNVNLNSQQNQNNINRRQQ